MKSIKNLSIPATMRALVLEEFGKSPVIKTVAVPTPGNAEILVKIHSSPINPSDNSFIKGSYSTNKNLPVIPGFEASGTVIATGSSLLSRRLMGKQVACFAPSDGNGTWAEFMTTKNTLAIPLADGIDAEQGSMLMVNPISVFAMIDIAKKGKHKAIANTAASSALGRLLVVVCTDQHIPLVNIVRREEQKKILTDLGATHVLVSEDSDFKVQLKRLFHKLEVTLALDAIGGRSVFELADTLPTNGEVMVYGGLSEEPASVNPARLIFEQKKITGFWTSAWVKEQSLIKKLWIFRQIQRYIKEVHQNTIQKRIALEEVAECLATYKSTMSAGKILVQPWESINM